MMAFKESYDTALEFHGHKCPAMPMGLRAGLAAMRALCVERSRERNCLSRPKQAEDMPQGALLTA